MPRKAGGDRVRQRGPTQPGRERTRQRGRAKKGEGVCGDRAAHDQVGVERGNRAAQRNGWGVGGNGAVHHQAGVGARRRGCAKNKSVSGRQRDLAGVTGQIIKRVLGLRDKFGTGRRILIQKLDVKSAFRQVGVDPAKAAEFEYGRRACLFIDVRLQFGRRRSPGLWGMIASVIPEAQRQATKEELAGEVLPNKGGRWEGCGGCN